MRSSIKIGTFFRTRIRIHYTWILVFILIPWAVSTQYSTETAFTMRIALGAFTFLLYFFAVFFREVALLLLAVYKGVVIESVTIFAFGGLIQADQETISPSHEMLLAVSGMLCNLFITCVFYFSYLLLDNTGLAVFDVPLKWLAFVFFTLSLFHIIPGFPLEGGRILHVILWKSTGDIQRATRIAGWIGWVIGFIVTVGGILMLIFTVERFTGIFFTGLGLILQNASTHGVRHLRKLIMQVPGRDDEGS